MPSIYFFYAYFVCGSLLAISFHYLFFHFDIFIIIVCKMGEFVCINHSTLETNLGRVGQILNTFPHGNLASQHSL